MLYYTLSPSKLVAIYLLRVGHGRFTARDKFMIEDFLGSILYSIHEILILMLKNVYITIYINIYDIYMSLKMFVGTWIEMK